MADADEDRIPSIPTLTDSTNPDNADKNSDSDGDSDAAPDYRFLPGASSSNKKNALPARGTKDFEPNATLRQFNTLDVSRQAMTDALSVVRVHSSKKGEMVGVYYADEQDWDGGKFDALSDDEDEQGKNDEIIENEKRRLKKSGALMSGEGRCVVVEKFTNTYVRTMGKSDRRNWIWLLPEEALYLIERGSLDIRYEIQDGDEEEDEDEDDDSTSSEESTESEVATAPILESSKAQDNQLGQDQSTNSLFDNRTDSLALEGESKLLSTSGPPAEDASSQLKMSNIPMSLQGAYSAFIGKSGLTLERYTVYANLRRAGYIVQRAPTWDGPVTPGTGTGSTDLATQTEKSLSTAGQSEQMPLISRLLSFLFKSSPKPNSTPCHNSITGPLISPGLFRNYYDIYRQIHLIPQYHHAESSTDLPAIDSSGTTATSNSPNTPSSAQSQSTSPPTDEPPLYPTYTLHKPSTLQSYKKTSPPPPHYHVTVLPSRTTQIPTSSQIGDLLASLPGDPLPNAERKKLETRIKHGKRSVLVAIVDCGLVSYLRFSSGGFEEALWGENERRGVGRVGKGGGGAGRGRGSARGGRGRGRGRGGGGA